MQKRSRPLQPPLGHLHGQRDDPGRARQASKIPARPDLQNHSDVSGHEGDGRRHEVQADAALASRAGCVVHRHPFQLGHQQQEEQVRIVAVRDVKEIFLKIEENTCHNCYCCKENIFKLCRQEKELLLLLNFFFENNRKNRLEMLLLLLLLLL